MFSNLTEYLDFTEVFCDRCKKHDELAIKNNKISCPTEEALVLTSFTGDKKHFPYDGLKPINNLCRYACKKFETDDKKLMESYREVMKE